MNTAVLRHHADFRRLWVGQAASKLGSRGSVVSVPLLVLAITHSPSMMAAVALVESVAEVGVLLPAGVLADRFDRRTIMALSDLGCLLAVGTLAYAAAAEVASLPLVLVTCAVDCALGSLFAGSSAATFRRLVPAEDLGEAVALVQARNSAIYLVGPLLGGAAFGIAPWLPFALDAASYVVSLLLLLQIRTSLAAPARARTSASDHRAFLRETTAGLRFVLHRPFLRYVVVVAATLNSIFGGIVVAAIAVCDAAHASASSIGAVVTSAGIGAMIGSVAMPWLRRRYSSGPLVLGTLAVMVTLVPLMGIVGRPALIGALIVACSVLAPVLSAVILTELTAITPDELQGRVQSAFSFAALCATPVGPVIAGAALGVWGATGAFLCLDLALAAAFVYSIAGVRQLRALHDEAAAAADVSVA